MKRELATIQKIKDIQPIEGADNILLATVLGWKVIVPKSENHKIGDLVVYCEIDSFLPMEPEFEFLRKSSYKKMSDGSEGYRLRTMKMRKQISQGLIIPIEVAYKVYKRHMTNFDMFWFEGLDVTDMIGIKKYEPPIPAQLAGKVKGRFPSFVQKTDEERIQNLDDEYDELKKHKYFVTEKLDGCLDGNTIITTEHGDKTIKEVCENKNVAKVLSFDLNTGKKIMDDVVGFSIKSDNRTWYEIETENGNTLKVTGNHKIYVPSLKCYRRVDKLIGNEDILLKS